MERKDYPPLYLAADDASNRLQKYLKIGIASQGGLLIAGSLLALVSMASKWISIAAAALFFASLAVHIFAAIQKYQKRWYASRALAESVKTVSWRFVMQAEPFGDPSTERDKDRFLSILKELLSENKDMATDLDSPSALSDQISVRMMDIRQLPFKDLIETYRTERVLEQLNWYDRKSKSNKKMANCFFALIVASYSVAVGLSLYKIADPGNTFLPIEVFAVVAGVLIAWSQMRRYSELHAAYSLTAHEVGIINQRLAAVKSSSQLREYVADSENAFSREHTQWAARRDHD